MAIKNYQNQSNNGPERFVIGYIGTTCWWTNIPVFNNPNGEALLAMTDGELENLAYADLKARDKIRTEKYKRPNNKAQADLQGGMPGEEYYGVCRAKVILEFREARKKHLSETT